MYYPILLSYRHNIRHVHVEVDSILYNEQVFSTNSSSADCATSYGGLVHSELRVDRKCREDQT